MFGLTAKNRIIGQEVGIINRGPSNCCGQDKAMIDNNDEMFSKVEVGGTSFLTVQSGSRSQQNLSGLPLTLHDSTVLKYVCPEIFVFEELPNQSTHFNEFSIKLIINDNHY